MVRFNIYRDICFKNCLILVIYGRYDKVEYIDICGVIEDFGFWVCYCEWSRKEYVKCFFVCID